MGAPIASTVLYAEFGDTFCACIAAIVGAPLAPTMSFTEAALSCTLLTARWVIAQARHQKLVAPSAPLGQPS